MPLCSTNAKKNPGIRYHEFPSDLRRREAWLRNISRQGECKGSKWEPNDRSLVCSLHFTEEDYRKNVKLRILLPSAVPTVFPKYPHYMQNENGQERRKRARISGSDSSGTSGTGRECGGLEKESQSHVLLPYCDGKQTFDAEASATLPLSSSGRASASCDSAGFVEQASQTTVDFVTVSNEAKKTERRLTAKVTRQKAALQKLQSKYDDCRQLLQKYEASEPVQAFLQVLEAAEEGDKTALFIANQASNYSRKKPSYSDSILRECVLWKACSSKGYEYARSRNLLKLPCRATLQKYVGQSTGEIGTTSLIKERLRVEYEGIGVEQEAYCSLIIDEMAIQQKVIYDKQVDKIFGLVDMGAAEDTTTVPEVANRLLCFVLRGLSTAYVIPVGYYFTRALKHDKLFSMTMEVMEAAEQVGFRVARVVTDNHQTNVALFKDFSEDGALAHAVPHPLREGDPLFLSFDPNHLIKNLRNNFLERELMFDEQLIRGGFYLKKLFEMQRQLLVKPVRFLTRAHVEPNNLEKMKVSRATQIFSAPVTATLEFLQKNPQCHPDASEFEDSAATITFLKMVAQWYALHNIGAVKPRGQDEQPFVLTDDERLSWLEVDFVGFIEELQTNAGKSKQKLTKETYEATLLTTKSTVALIEYLLDHIK